jgi:lipopolysaccharide transport system ATP-binding protein
MPDASPPIAISIQNLGKSYRRYHRPSDRLKELLLPGKPRAQEFWALQDVSFDIYQGETVGIIGRNGAGKSSLLQIICGTLRPTTGQVQVNGRVAALLELGAGFNPEFTGRENVYMNGAIMGLPRQAIAERFEAIAAFADIGGFLDQPVKTYSSGMYVRLAFAAAIHVDPDILIVDEALAVGDMFFQAKCMARMRQMMQQGTTVLFVSHDTPAVKGLCQKAVLLDHGRLLLVDSADVVVERYFAMKVQSDQPLLTPSPAKGSRTHLPQGSEWDKAQLNQAEFTQRASFQRLQNGKASFANLQLLNQRQEPIVAVNYGETITLRMFIEIHADCDEIGMGYHIRDKNGTDVVYADSHLTGQWLRNLRAGDRYIVDWQFEARLMQGNYAIACGMSIAIDLEASQVDFCDFVPLGVQFTMAPRPGSPLYGLVHLANRVEVRAIAGASLEGAAFEPGPSKMNAEMNAEKTAVVEV